MKRAQFKNDDTKNDQTSEESVPGSHREANSPAERFKIFKVNFFNIGLILAAMIVLGFNAVNYHTELNNAAVHSEEQKVDENVAVNEKDEKKHYLSLADKNFLQCCKMERMIPEECYGLCRFEQLTAEQVVNEIGYNHCPLKATGHILLCASAYKDHTECCKRAGIGQDEDTKHCIYFCNPAGGMPSMDIQQAGKCLAKFAQIKQCFEQTPEY